MSGDYIEREALKEAFEEDGHLSAYIEEMIDDIPAADVVEVRRGRWIYAGIRGRFPACKCSACGNVENADWAVLGDNVNYCPNCGAKMNGGQDDGE